MINISFNEIEDHLADSKSIKLQTLVFGVCNSCHNNFSVGLYNLYRRNDFEEKCHKCKLSDSKKVEKWGDIYLNSEDEIPTLLEKIDNCSTPTSWKTTNVIFICKKCNKQKKIQLKSFIKNPKIICSSCRCINTNVERYGYKTSFCTQETQLKAQKAQIEKYGGVGLAADIAKQKAIETNLKKYGQVNPLSKGTVAYEKRNKTVKDKYGVNNVFQDVDIKEKIIETNIERYGADNPFSSDTLKEKIKRTNRERYGVDYPQQNESIRKKREQTCLQKYGYTSVLGSKYFKDNCFNVNNNVKYIYDNICFDSSWELIFYIYNVDHNKNVIRNPKKFSFIYNSQEHFYFPDFEVDGQLYEIKGNQFWKEDGTMCNPYDHSQDDLFEAKHQCGLKNNVIFLKKTDLLHMMEYVKSTYTDNYVQLFRKDLEFPYLNTNLTDKSDMGMIRYFHKSIYTASKKGYLSPYEAWKDKNLVKRSALNRLKYVHRCMPTDIIQGFSIAKIAPKISVFKPSTAKRLINTYLHAYSEVFDPFSGFSGRLLGAINCNKKYIGQDLNEQHVKESNQIIEYKGLENCRIIQQDILTDTSHDYECLFTCPPYGGKEHWNKDNDDVEKSCDEWIDICLKKYNCQRYLFVVDETEKYKNNIVETITNKSHFGTNNEYVILI